jgi:thiamine biosynthesis protein ThiS
VTGLEPANGGTTTHCLNHLATPAKLSFERLYQSTLIYVYIIYKKLLILFMTNIRYFYLNGQTYMTDSSLSLLDLILYFNYNKSLLVIEYNNVICNKKNWDKIFITNADKIEIVTIVGGG